MSITIYGASDDLIEVEGAISEEFDVGVSDDEWLIACSEGTVLRITNKTGEWRITPVAHGSGALAISQCPEGDEDDYSDRATIDAESIAWVVLGRAGAIAQRRRP
jgi:hypothetical protein